MPKREGNGVSEYPAKKTKKAKNGGAKNIMVPGEEPVLPSREDSNVVSTTNLRRRGKGKLIPDTVVESTIPTEPKPVIPPIPIESEPEIVVPPSAPAEPKIEVVIPEVVEGGHIPKNEKAKEKKEEKKLETIDVEVIETGLVSRRNSSEKDGRLIELNRRLDDARGFYVQQDREMEKGGSVMKKITGFFKRLDSGTLKESFENSKLAYEDALRTYKDAILKTEVGDKEEAGIVAEWLTKGEFLSLENEKMEAKMKEEKGWSEKITNGYLGMVDRYRKLSTTKKIAIGLGISTVGFGIGLTGGTLLAGGLLTSRQIFSMSVSSVGFKGMFEGIAQRARAKKGEKEAENISSEAIKKTDDGKEMLDIESFSGKLNEKIEQINSQLQSEKKDQKFRTWAAVGSGVVLSYVARYFGKEALEHSGVKEVLKNAGEKVSDIIGNQKSVMGLGCHPETVAKVGISSEGLKTLQEQVAKENIVSGDNLAETKPEELVNLKVAKGSSLEGTIIRHLKEQGMKGEEAGKKAHRMALEFLGSQEATEHHLIHPEAKIVLDASGGKILSVDDAGSIISAPSENASGLDYEKLMDRSNDFPSVPKDASFDPSLAETGDFLDENAGSLLKIANTDLTEWQTMPERGADVDKYATLGANFTKSLAKLIGGNYFEDWAAVRGLPMKDALKGDSESSKRMSALVARLLKAKLPEADEEVVKQFKKAINPKGEEKVYDWMKRIAILVKHSGVKKI